MKALIKHFLPAALLVGFLAGPAQNSGYAQTSQPLTLTAEINDPLQADGGTWWRKETWSGSFLFISWSDSLELDLTPVADFSGQTLTVSCPGNVDLNQSSQCGWPAKIKFVSTDPGTISQNPNVALGLTIAVLFNGNGPTATLKNPQTYSYPSSGDIDCYGFGNPASVSTNQTETLYSTDLLGDVASAFGFGFPSWLASINLNVNADLSVSQTLTPLSIFSSAGQIVLCGEPLSVNTSQCSYTLRQIQALWSDNLNVSEGLGVTFGISALFGILNWNSGNVIDTGPIFTESDNIRVTSDPVADLVFNFPQYNVTVNQTPNGTVSPSSEIVCAGECVTFTATPAPGYYVCSWDVDGVQWNILGKGGALPRPWQGNTLELPPFEKDHTVQANFCQGSGNGGPFGSIGNSITNIISLTSTSATFVSGLSLQGTAAGSYWFDYGTSLAYDQATDPVALPPVTGDFFTTNQLTGLTPNTTYNVALVASDITGTTTGPNATFTTLPAPASIAVTGIVVLTPSSVLLQGAINPNGSPLDTWFQWGTTMAYGVSGPTPPIALLNDNTNDPVAVLASNLQPGATYHYQLVASNIQGVVTSADETFTMPGAGPSISSAMPTNVTSDSAAVSLAVNPNGLDTRVWVTWGAGGSSSGQDQATATAFCGNGSSETSLTVSQLYPLMASNLYHFQVVASNILGVSTSPVATFTTGAPLPPLLSQPVIIPGVGLEIQVAGSYGQTVSIQAAPDLHSFSNWTTLRTMTFSNNVIPFLDSSFSNTTMRFYRAVQSGFSNTTMQVH